MLETLTVSDSSSRPGNSDEEIVNEVSVVVIPDFILDTMKHYDLDISDLETKAGVEKLLSVVSKVDLKTMVAYNKMFSKEFFNNDWTRHDTYGTIIDRIYYSIPEIIDIDREIYQDALKVYFNKNLDVDDIILNKDNVKDFYRTEVTDNTLYVVLTLGFTNYVINKDEQFVNLVSDDIVNLMVKMFTEDRVTKLYMFRDYLDKKFRRISK